MEYFESVATFAPSMSKTLGILSPTVAIEAFVSYSSDPVVRCMLKMKPQHDTIGGNQGKQPPRSKVLPGHTYAMQLVLEAKMKLVRYVSQTLTVPRSDVFFSNDLAEKPS